VGAIIQQVPRSVLAEAYQVIVCAQAVRGIRPGVAVGHFENAGETGYAVLLVPGEKPTADTSLWFSVDPNLPQTS
jgi:hypothetical protein